MLTRFGGVVPDRAYLGPIESGGSIIALLYCDQGPGGARKADNGGPGMRGVKRGSPPGRRVYSKVRELPRHFNGLGISILSTPRGVMSDAEARAANVGGEVICRVF